MQRLVIPSIANKTTAMRSRLAWRIENVSREAADVFLYDIIGEWGVTAGDFVAELRSLGNVAINLHINSEGGDVFDGLAIYQALKQHSAKVTAYIDALAASAASFIAMAADSIYIAKNASMFIHEAMGAAIGNAADMRKLAELLDDSSENIASIYAERAGGTTSSWREAMKAETWYRGQEAVDAGLADELQDDAKVAAKVTPLRSARAEPPVRIAARLHNQAGDNSFGALLSAASQEHLTALADEWLSRAAITMPEYVELANLLNAAGEDFAAALQTLSFADREVPAPEPPQDDLGLGQSLADLFRDNASFSPEPTPEEALVAALTKQPLSAAVTTGVKSAHGGK